MKGTGPGLKDILVPYLLRRAEFPPAGSPVVRFYRSRNGLFHFLRKQCRLCHRPPNVLYYDSPRFGFLCDACHTRAMEERLERLRSVRDPSRLPPEFRLVCREEKV